MTEDKKFDSFKNISHIEYIIFGVYIIYIILEDTYFKIRGRFE